MLTALNLASVLAALFFVLGTSGLFSDIFHDALASGPVVWPWSSSSISVTLAITVLVVIHGGIYALRYLWARRPWVPGGLYAFAWIQFLGAYLSFSFVACACAFIVRFAFLDDSSSTVHGANLPGPLILLGLFAFSAYPFGRLLSFFEPFEATKPVEPTGISSSPSDLITSHTAGNSPGGSLRR